MTINWTAGVYHDHNKWLVQEEKMNFLYPIVMIILFLSSGSFAFANQDGAVQFVDLEKAVPGLQCDARYAGNNNFTGKPLPGYERSICMGSEELAQGLILAQRHVEQYGFALIVYDAYRPQRAVNHLVRWAKDALDVLEKQNYYPDVPKTKLIPEGYIAPRSGHSRGGTVDLSIIDVNTGEILDMGTPYDFFSPQSGLAAKNLSISHRANRAFLSAAMQAAGFLPYDVEWWHFRLADEPWPTTYFDMPVK